MATSPVQLRIDDDVIDHIKRMARMRAVDEDKDIDWRDLIREAIYQVYPLPKGDSDGEEAGVQEHGSL